LFVPTDKLMERSVNVIHHKAQNNDLGQQVKRSQGNMSSVYMGCETKACHHSQN